LPSLNCTVCDWFLTVPPVLFPVKTKRQHMNRRDPHDQIAWYGICGGVKELFLSQRPHSSLVAQSHLSLALPWNSHLSECPCLAFCGPVRCLAVVGVFLGASSKPSSPPRRRKSQAPNSSAQTTHHKKRMFDMTS
jgi:hypothetical protein